MKADGRTRLEQVLKETNKLLSEYERKIPAESNPARRNELKAEYEKTLQRVREFEELLSVYHSVAESTATGPTVEQKSPLPPIATQVSPDVLTAQTATQDMERLDVVLERLALPHWFTSDMLPMLLSDLLPDTRKQAQAVEDLLEYRQVESAPGDNHYSVSEQQRSNLLKSWQEHNKRSEFTRLSAMLADYYAELADHTENKVKQNDWRGEQLYHLVVSDPDQAMQLLRIWFDESVEEQFDLNQAYCWLLMLEERRDLLAELENMRMPRAEWTTELIQRSEYLSARAFWTEEWFRTINYQERDELKHRLEDFFNPSCEDVPWLLNLHAQGGYGKTATIQWLLSRYLLPRGFICARFDYDRLFINKRLEIFQQPHKILALLSENLNAQRPNKIEALQRQSELRSDPVGHFTLVLRDTYGNKNIVFFIDTLELLLEDDDLTNPGLALTELLKVLVSIREGTIPYGGSIPGYTNLRVVLSGRQPLAKLYEHELRQAFFPGGTEDDNGKASLPLVDLKVSGFTREEGKKYLVQKRKLVDLTEYKIGVILDKASESSATVTITEPILHEARIMPLKLAQYADLLKEDPKIDIADILATDDIDTIFLVKRILEHIQNHAIRWLLRYGVIFRRLDVEAAQVLMPFLERALAGDKELDHPDWDPPKVSAALQASRQQAGKPVGEINQLFNQLTRYSWVERQDDYIKIHPEVSKPQLQIVANQKIFQVLQQAAFEHYKQRTEYTSNLQQKADYLREAIFHVLQTGENGIDQWREQIAHYRSGPALMLWTLVDETFLRSKHPWQSTSLPDEDRIQAYLALANVLLIERDQPFFRDERKQLAEAEDIAQQAFRLTTKVKLKDSGNSTRLLQARIALARHKLPEALDAAEKSAMEATTTNLATNQKAEALVVLGEAEAANSLWEKALDTLRFANRSVREALENHGLLAAVAIASVSSVYRLVRLELIDQLLNSPNWREALPLMDEVRADYSDDPMVLAKAAQMAFKQARFQEATHLYQQAIALSSGTQAASFAAKQQQVQLYQGKHIHVSANDTSMIAVTAAAMRANWLVMESLLDSQLVKAVEAKNLEVINTLLQYYVEVIGDWQQVTSLLERGAKWLRKLSENDPAVSRYNVLRWHIDLLTCSIILKPDAALKECESRLKQVTELRTPEARVRAKAYLLLVRFYGGFATEPTRAKEREAVKIYTHYATKALAHTFDLLLELAPLDQVDIMRTLAALPGWSSSLINHVALDPAERSTVLLLSKSLAPTNSSGQDSFLARLASNSDQRFEAKLDALGRQILAGGADWPLLYTSFARLLAAFGKSKEARQFLREAPIHRETQTPNMRVLIDQDRAFIAPWKEGDRIIISAIAYLERTLEAEARGSLNEELQLIRAYLSLDRGTTEKQWRIVFDQSPRPFLSDPGNTRLAQDFLILRAVSHIRSGHLNEATFTLKEAEEVVLSLGNTNAVNAIRTAQSQLQSVLQSRLESASPKTEQHPAVDKQADLPLQASSASKEDSQGLELLLKQVNDDTIEVVLTKLPLRAKRFKTQTQLQGIKQLLPQGTALKTLPDLDYWQKLLNADSNLGQSIEQIGATLLNDLLPVDWQGRSLLTHSLRQSNQPLRLIVQGSKLEGLPWGILCNTPTRSWLSTQFRCSYNRPREEPLMMRGESLAVFSSIASRADDTTFRQMQKLFQEEAGSNWFYSFDMPGQGGSSESAKVSAASLPRQVKLLHLIGDLSELNDVEGIFLNMGTSSSSEPFERLTPDHLARRLRQLSISNSLIILEPLSTGSNIEDIRVLLLRNSYAAALARLGAWTILAIGPRHCPTTTRLVQQLLNVDPLTTDQLEIMVQEARRDTTPSSFDNLLEGQFELFYPTFR